MAIDLVTNNKTISETQEQELSRMHKLQRQDKNRGPLNIRTPKVECATKRAKWFGMPPTPLATAPVWRPSEPRF